MLSKKSVGFGCVGSKINIYIANRPPIDNYPELDCLKGLIAGEISYISQHTSNHWRKLFNVCAKFIFDWHHQKATQDLPPTWQDYRDLHLFQPHSNESLLFSPPEFLKDDNAIHIVAGKTYAAELALPPVIWLDKYFAVNESHRLFVSPYPDYRQLSNDRIAQLINLMKNLK
ncbi:MAG: hypothetical protein EOO68_09835 [Moraxellaceae bacterium]|nr:MAG: hypothetical protein EOO68_09835 [Moraxellaceae bacterium]